LAQSSITHAHPDHANDTNELNEAPIASLESIANIFRDTAEIERKWWTLVFGDD